MTPTLLRRWYRLAASTARLFRRWLIGHHGVESLTGLATASILAAWEWRAGHVVFAVILAVVALASLIATISRLIDAHAELLLARNDAGTRRAIDSGNFVLVGFVPVGEYDDTVISPREIN